VVDEFDQLVSRGRRRWVAALLVNLAALSVAGFLVYALVTRSGVVTVQSVVASETIRISAERRGTIKAVYTAVGQQFKEGDLLFELESDPLLDSQVAETEKRIKDYERDIAELESASARRLREFDPNFKIESARQQIREKQVTVKNLATSLDSANRRLAIKEDMVKKAQELFAAGAITRARLDSYRLDCETERAACDKILAETNLLQTEITGLEKQIASYIQWKADLTSSTAEQVRNIRDKQAAVTAELAKLLSEKTLLTCRSKVSGLVAAVLKNKGEGVAPGEPILEVTTGGNIWTEAYFRPETVNHVRSGDRMTVRYGAMTFPAIVESINPITKPFPFQRPMVLGTENYVVVRLVFMEPEPAKQAGLRPGMLVTTEMTTSEGILYRLGLKRSSGSDQANP